MAAGLSPAVAQATATQPDPTSTYIVMPLKRVGVDHKIAAANGYEVRVDSKGIEYAVKKGEFATLNELPGECGSSFVYFTAVDTKKHYTSIYTGYTIRSGWPGAVYTNWKVGVIDNYGASTKSWNDPSTPTHFWAKSKGFTSSGPGYAYADVLLGSIATLANGTICYSHGPSASAYL
ncbi:MULTISPECIES: hypothetical protein [unclassified Micromonospora]|uniref:hypothetical protein n=1 Tax=unclassified Micromonospora TaxID=2617518 RepID=UPI001C215B71|nr:MULTISPECIES: hypothetical protein [unclassified Micromonospora]MBU8857787.1 hypothetical protein [Micromonospora sp. WMMB482]MDM4783417.1 hypothetical protein [Micromonospora sp. b486]